MLVALGDVAGKGVEAALVMAMMISAIESQARLTPGPAACLHALQGRLMGQLQACETFVSLMVAVIDTERRQLVLANAGMPPLLLLRASQTRAIELNGVPLGILERPGYEQQCVDLLPGDRVVLVTDGVIEARNAHRELFGYERLLTALSRQPATHAPAQLVDSLLATITAFARDAEQHDDITALALQPGIRL